MQRTTIVTRCIVHILLKFKYDCVVCAYRSQEIVVYAFSFIFDRCNLHLE